MQQQIWLGWKLDEEDRSALLERFAPRYSRPVADHVTFGPAGKAPPMPEASHAIVIGHADDAAGVEALVVEVAGTHERWDASTYHITWSLAERRQAKESNQVITERGWEPVDGAPRVGLTPARWP